MTDFNKVKSYYNEFFDEENRFFSSSGQLSFEMLCTELNKYIGKNSDILDIGGGCGEYTKYFAEKGNRLYYGDLSSALVDKVKIKLANIPNVISIQEANIIQLNQYENDFFDFVFCFGPFLHLTAITERVKAVSEISRILKKGSIAFISIIPFNVGFNLLIRKVVKYPTNATSDIIKNFKENSIIQGFPFGNIQEGYFPKKEEIFELCSKKFDIIDFLSIKGLASEISDELNTIKNKNKLLLTL